MGTVSNWGFYPEIDAEVHSTEQGEALATIIKEADKLIARGNGRCYGDSSLQKNIFSTNRLNKFIEFNTDSGILHCESGVLLSEILEVVVPKGFFLPVTPGTKFITIGGAVASDIHGKNHHSEGSFATCIQQLTVYDRHGVSRTCSRTELPELFRETIGGMGLTGIISSVSILLKPISSAYINQVSIKAKNLDELFELFKKHHGTTYSVAWIDCLARGKRMGRSILLLGEHAQKEQLNAKLSQNPLQAHSNNQLNIPFKFPSFVLNKLSIKAFNALYYGKVLKKESKQVLHYDKYFYPLDGLKNWNRIYGKNGFTQYQFVIPFERGEEGMRKILDRISKSGEGSFLAVLKTMGAKDSWSSKLSFPQEGYTLALDFKLSPKVLKLLDELDKIVLEYDGKLYLTKDSRMSAETLGKSYFKGITASDADGAKFASVQSERLKIPALIKEG